MRHVISRIPLRARRAGGLLVALGFALLIADAGTFRAASSAVALAKAEPQGQTKGFLIVRSDLGIHYGKFEEECPDGFEKTVEEGYLSTKTPAERERLLKPENAREYANGWKNEFITGPGGENVCNNPKSFMKDPRHPPYGGVKGKVAHGLNLDGTTDGRATANACAHENFAGVNGEPGVDNQLSRAVGCAKNVRGLGPPPAPVRIDSFLIEIRGLDDPKNDDHVEVGIYSREEAPLQGSDGSALPHQTLAIAKNPLWRATVAGRIVDGQLTTDRLDAMHLRHVLPTWGAYGLNYSFEFYDVRFRMSIQPDGTLAGVMGGYRPIENIFTVGRCCKGTASTANTNCAAEHKTLALMADGYPDPATGQCTRISSATNFTGIPVFIVPASADLSSKK